MFELENLKELEDEIKKCSRCGLCRSICPVFKETGTESMVARGRMEIIESILSKKIDFTNRVSDIIDSCLLCGACHKNCPGGVMVDTIVLKARCDRVEKFGLLYLQEFIFHYILENRSLFKMSIDMALYFQEYFSKSSSQEHMRHLPFFISGLEKKRLIPELSKERLSQIFPIKVTNSKRKLRVGFFSGCLLEYVYTDIGKSVIEVLIKNDIEVIIPPGQKCCGISVLIAGDKKGFRRLAESNVKAFLSYELDAIIVACASCGSALKNEYPMLFKNTKLESEVERFSKKVKDISEFIDEFIPYRHKIVSDVKYNITYHDPCHLNHKQNINAAPRKIINQISKSFVEMTDSSACCGGGGSFSLYYYDIANKIRSRKIINIEETNAEIVATACPGCIMHLRDGLGQKDSKIKVMHVIELLNKAM
ncbi:MAG: (Fe-S)-binding protein [Candidatus Firestonebacteria bacterium]|nr:(Fe-S)-binding protein [Candidatus Firestonebacteria bacterium]